MAGQGSAEAAPLAASFEARFGAPPEVAARAPGRINLIGEHTDHQLGLVLPCAVDRELQALAARGEGRRARVFSRERGEEAHFDSGAPRRTGGWLDYVQGVVAALAEAGRPVRGFDLLLASELPEGAGLSSSAALQIAVATALDALFELGLSARERAELAHASETRFVGVACGIMDPFASALGRRDCALRLDCRSREVRAVPLAADRVRLLVAHSGVTRKLTAGAYGARVAECEQAVRAARAVLGRELASLRDVHPTDLPDLEARLDATLLRRARHIVTENARVDAVCAALERGDLSAVGDAVRAGQQSLRDDFAVSTPELDALCEIADAQPGVYGSRLTGAGFGGCTLHLVRPDAVDAAAAALAAGFASRFDRRPPLLALTPTEGASAS